MPRFVYGHHAAPHSPLEVRLENYASAIRLEPRAAVHVTDWQPAEVDGRLVFRPMQLNLRPHAQQRARVRLGTAKHAQLHAVSRLIRNGASRKRHLDERRSEQQNRRCNHKGDHSRGQRSLRQVFRFSRSERGRLRVFHFTSMLATTAGASVIASVRERICEHVTRQPTDVELLHASLCASCVESDSMLEFMMDRNLCRQLKPLKRKLKLSLEEFLLILNGVGSCNGPGLATVLQDARFQQFQKRFEQDLATTIGEREQDKLWQRPITRLLAFVIVHSTDDVQDKAEALLGNIVRSDARRLEDIRASCEDATVDVMLVSTALCALSEFLV